MMMRRFFAFLFRHEWEVDKTRVRFLRGVPMTTIACQRCGRAEEYPVLDRQTFSRLFRMRGCPGKAADVR